MPSQPPPAVTSVLRIPLEQLAHGPNVRTELTGIEELAGQLRDFGQQQLITVVEAPDGRYRVLDGNRRLAAARLIKLPHLDGVLRTVASDVERITRQLLMGVSGHNLSPIDEARAIEALMFTHHQSREQIAGRFHKGPGWVRDRLALLQLDRTEQADVAAGRMSVAHATAIVRGRRNGDTPRSQLVPTPAAQPKPQRHCRTCSCGAP